MVLGFGRPRRPGKPLKNMGGKAPHLFERFPGRPGPPRPPKSAISGQKPCIKNPSVLLLVVLRFLSIRSLFGMAGRPRPRPLLSRFRARGDFGGGPLGTRALAGYLKAAGRSRSPGRQVLGARRSAGPLGVCVCVCVCVCAHMSGSGTDARDGRPPP